MPPTPDRDPPPLPAADCLTGVWRRELLALPDGYRDDTSLVLWLQGPSLYCDIRLPAPGGVAAMDAFAGAIELTPEETALRCRWRREIDWATTPGPADIGRLTWIGDGETRRLREDGVETEYYEIWRKETEAAPGDGVARFSDAAGRIGYLAWIGDLALWIRGRSDDADSLGEDLDPGMEAVLTRWDASESAYRVEQSTSPGRSPGEILLRGPVRDPAHLSVSEHGAGGRQRACEWRATTLEPVR